MRRNMMSDYVDLCIVISSIALSTVLIGLPILAVVSIVFEWPSFLIMLLLLFTLAEFIITTIILSMFGIAMKEGSI